MKTLLTVKTDKDLKKAAQETAEELGVPLGTLVGAFLRQLVRNKEVSFSAEYRPTPYLQKIIKEAEEERLAGKVHGPFDSVDDMFKHLMSRRVKK